MNIKVIVCDIDGTIIEIKKDGYGNLPSQKIRDSFLEVAKNRYIVLATGRPLQETNKIAEYLGVQYVIMNNGGSIMDMFSNEEIHSSTLDPNIVKKIFKLFEGNQIFHNDTEIPNSLIFSAYPSTQSIHTICSKGDIPHLLSELSNIDEISYHTFPHWDDQLIGLYVGNEHATKGHAIIELSKYLGIPIYSFAAVGDSPNDLSMFKVCGYSIAMGNASEEVRKNADTTVSSVYDDGILEAFHIIST